MLQEILDDNLRARRAEVFGDENFVNRAICLNFMAQIKTPLPSASPSAFTRILPAK